MPFDAASSELIQSRAAPQLPVKLFEIEFWTPPNPTGPLPRNYWNRERREIVYEAKENGMQGKDLAAHLSQLTGRKISEGTIWTLLYEERTERRIKELLRENGFEGFEDLERRSQQPIYIKLAPDDDHGKILKHLARHYPKVSIENMGQQTGDGRCSLPAPQLLQQIRPRTPALLWTAEFKEAVNELMNNGASDEELVDYILKTKGRNITPENIKRALRPLRRASQPANAPTPNAVEEVALSASRIATRRSKRKAKAADLPETATTSGSSSIMIMPSVAAAKNEVVTPEVNDFHALIESEIPRLKRLALFLTKDATKAEDLLQDVVERMLVKEHLWKPGTNFRNWLSVVMRNFFTSQTRKEKTRFLQTTVHSMDDVGEPNLTASEPQIKALERKELAKALHQLPLPQKQVIVLTTIEGYTYKEAAAALTIPEHLVRSRAGYAKEKLRNMMGCDSSQHRRKTIAPAIAA